MSGERALLARLMQGPATGDALAEASGQTRAAVWKRVQALRDAGIAIDAASGRGYTLAQSLDLLDPGAIERAIPASARDRLASLDVAWSVDSTNSALLRAPSRGDDRLDVLLAERQTAGRGRRGRVWASPMAAHLYLSAARGFAGGLARLGGLSLVAGIATIDALHALGCTAARLKWPNDVVVADDDGLRKLGGLLVEGAGEHAGPARAVIGLGLNVRMPAAYGPGIDQPWTDLAHVDPPMTDRNLLAATVVTHWIEAFDRFEVEGLAPSLGRYAEVDALASRAVVVQAPHGAFDAVAVGLADDGALRVRTPDGAVTCVHAGEVSVRVEGGQA